VQAVQLWELLIVEVQMLRKSKVEVELETAELGASFTVSPCPQKMAARSAGPILI